MFFCCTFIDRVALIVRVYALQDPDAAFETGLHSCGCCLNLHGLKVTYDDCHRMCKLLAFLAVCVLHDLLLMV